MAWVFVAVPPLLNCIYMWKDCRDWIMDLTWVRYASGRSNAPLRRERSDESGVDRDASTAALGSYRQIQDPAAVEEGDAMWMKDMGKGSIGTPTGGAFTSSPKGRTTFDSPSPTTFDSVLPPTPSPVRRAPSPLISQILRSQLETICDNVPN